MRILAFLLITGALALSAQNTMRKGLHARQNGTETTGVAPAVRYDTVIPRDNSLVDVKGYDKPLRSRRETFFATNTGQKPVCRIAVTLTYFDDKSRQLHKASHNVAADIPPGETRQIGLRSWDTQQAFYYSRSAVPSRAAQATPFDVTISVDTVFLAH